MSFCFSSLAMSLFDTYIYISVCVVRSARGILSVHSSLLCSLPCLAGKLPGKGSA